MPDVALPDLEDECFFIAPIGEEGSETRNRSDGVLEFIVQRAAEELGLTAVRGDQIAAPGQINLQVIDHILRAKAAVADLTGLNANVFYELAVRHAVKLPVALIADKDCEIPFDIAQMRVIKFDYQDLRSSDNCRRQIADHLKQALDTGNADSPISTAADVRSMQVGSPVERTVAEIVAGVESVTATQRDILDMVTRMARGVPARGSSFSALRHAREKLDELISRSIAMGERETANRGRDIADALEFHAINDLKIRNALSRPVFYDPTERRGGKSGDPRNGDPESAED
ncbi:hypothetical protein [Streptomyces hokutonensis]|uniref:hypothetical protein n=1 Tax=Streptomyces hokutonensis TaxID=1306990 RepID=UPI00131A00F9|nr:hypothetical protein [Streptomyces hokutonensis]